MTEPRPFTVSFSTQSADSSHAGAKLYNMADWTIVAVSAISACAGLGGGIMTQWFTARASQRAALQEAAWRRSDIQRGAILRLLVALENLEGLTGGAIATGSLTAPPPDVLREISAAVSEARLVVPADVYAEMEPYRHAIVVRANAFRSGVRADSRNDALREAEAKGLDSNGRLGELLEQYLVAARRLTG